jgi:hypothetical protein
MLSDGVGEKVQEGTASEDVEVVDIAQMLLAAVRRGGDAPQADEAVPQPEPAPTA